MRSTTARIAVGSGATIGGVLLGASIFGEPRAEAPDFRAIAAKLVERREQTGRGRVVYHVDRFVATADQADALRDALLASQRRPNPAIVDDLRFAVAAMGGTRESWRATCGFDGSTWARSLRLEEFMPAAGGAAQRPADLREHSDGAVEVAIEGGESTTLRAAGEEHPMSTVDITLAPWTDAIRLGASVPGQSISASSTDGYDSIVYDLAGSGASYSFLSRRGHAPAEVRTWRAADGPTSPRETLTWGYRDDDAHAIARPAALLRVAPRADGTLDATAWTIDSWSDEVDSSTLAPRLPPIRLEIEYIAGSETPVVSIKLPHYLVGAAACNYSAITVAYIVSALGGTDPAADFTMDGRVTADDITAAITVLTKG